LLKVEKNGDRCLAVPTVTNGLEVIVRRGDVAVGFLGLDVEFYVPKIWPEIKRIVGASLGNAVLLAFNFDLLFVGIFLGVMVYVPTKRDPEFIDEIVPGFLFLIRGDRKCCSPALKSAANSFTA
jgi:hypothetical protein